MKRFATFLCTVLIMGSAMVGAQVRDTVVFSAEYDSWRNLHNLTEMYSGFVGRCKVFGSDSKPYNFTLQSIKMVDGVLELRRGEGYVSSREPYIPSDSFKQFTRGYDVTVDYRSREPVALSNQKDTVAGDGGGAGSVSIHVPPGGLFKFRAGKALATVTRITVSGVIPGETVDLSTLAGNMKDYAGREVTLRGDGGLTVEYVYSCGDGGYRFYAKDDNHYEPKDLPLDGQCDYNRNVGRVQASDYDQSNWIELNIPAELAGGIDPAGLQAGQFSVDAVKGTVGRDTVNMSLTVSETPRLAAAVGGKLNTYIAPNFMGSVQTVGGTSYFFVTPKPMEVADVQWIVWSGDRASGKFVIPRQNEPTADGGRANTLGLQGGFCANFSMLAADGGDGPQLVDGAVYRLTGLIKKDSTPEVAMQPGRRAYNENAAVSGDYVVYPLELTMESPSVATGLNGAHAGQPVIRRTYVDMTGHERREPFSGPNIVVTTHSDGTTSMKKLLFP